MNKEKAFTKMIEGFSITNEYFTSDEYLVYNPNTGKIETEEGYHMITYWDPSYLPDVKWTVK